MPNLLPAKAIATARVTKRHMVRRSSTLRLREQRPIDVIIDDLSSEGCRLSSPVPLAAGDVISLGLPGIGTCTARVIWSDHQVAGCQFDQSLHTAQIEKIKLAHTVIAGSFGNAAFNVDQEGETMSRPSKFKRIILITGLSLISWGLFGFLGWAMKILVLPY